jgi:hypothetical protein
MDGEEMIVHLKIIIITLGKPDTVAPVYNSALRRQRKEDYKFEASLGM